MKTTNNKSANTLVGRLDCVFVFGSAGTDVAAHTPPPDTTS